MVTVTLSSHLAERIGLLLRAARLDPASYSIEGTHLAAIRQFEAIASELTPTVPQLGESLVVLRFDAPNAVYRIRVEGSGFGPVSSLEDLIAAIDSGLADGRVSAVTLTRGATALVTLTTSDSGYVLQTGADRIAFTGPLPTSLSQLTAMTTLLSLADRDSLAAMTNAERAALFGLLSDNGLSGVSITSGESALFSYSISPTQLRLTLAGFSYVLNGSFGSDFGPLLAAAYALDASFLRDGAFPDLTPLVGLGISGLRVLAPDGTQLLRITGPIATADQAAITGLSVDGQSLDPGSFMVFLQDHFIGGPGHEVIFGTPDPSNPDDPVGDYLNGMEGNDLIFGYGGNDQLRGHDGADTLRGGAGDDDLDGGRGNDHLYGGAGADYAYYHTEVNVRVDLTLTSVQDTGQGRDILRSVEGVVSGAGNDLLIGNGAANYLDGQAGNDTLRGGGGNDMLFAGDGDDVLEAGTGHDTLDGAFGFDMAVFRGATGLSLHLGHGGRQSSGSGSVTLIGIEALRGGGGNDRFTGTSARERLEGGGGNDLLEAAGGSDLLMGGTGRDTLRGGDGNDLLLGGRGNDTLTGGAGADHFVFASGEGADRITDFQDGRDRIAVISGAASFAEIGVTVQGGNTVLLIGSTTVTLLDTDPGQISAADFLFG